MNAAEIAEKYPDLIEGIARIIYSRGMKATKMDYIASELSISKRTLYEIFGSKEEMIGTVLETVMCSHRSKMQQAFEHSDNVLEGLMKVLLMHRDQMMVMSPEFFRDMDVRYRSMRGVYDRESDQRERDMLALCQRGVDEGVFRPDLNYPLYLRVLKIQMEAMKRMEEHFPEKFTIAELFEAITFGFLRSVATPRGYGVIDSEINRMRKKESK